MLESSETTPLAYNGGPRGSSRSNSSRRGSSNVTHYAAVAVSEGASLTAGKNSGRRGAVGAVGVLIVFGLAVSTLQQQEQRQQSSCCDNTYRGVFQQVR